MSIHPLRGPIVLITPNVAVDGGVASHVLTSARALRAHGSEVAIVASDDKDAEVPVTRVDGLTTEKLTMRAVHALDGALRSIEPSIVHLHNVDDAAAVEVSRRYAPTVVSAHGYSGCGPGTYFFRPGVECTRAHGPGCLPNMLLRGCAQTRSPERIAAAYRAAPRRLEGLRAADAVVVYSSAVKSHLERNQIGGVVVIALATAEVSPSPDPGKRSVLFVGRITPLKGLTTLLAALSQVDAQLSVCGAGWGSEAAQSAATSYGVRDRVEFLGWVDGQRLDAAYRGSRLVVVPSHWPEPFGLAGLEAMAHERPVIASATGGVPEWLQHGRTGLLVRPGDVGALASAMTELLGDVERCTEMGREGRAVALARFSSYAHVQESREVYASARRRWLMTHGTGADEI